MAIVVEREIENKNTARAGFESAKARDLLLKYGQEKGKKLIEGLKSKGRWYWDPEFPQDEEEIYYYTSAPRSIVNENSTANRMKLQGKETNPDAGLLAAMTGEQGPLASGALPAMETDGAEGERALAEALGSGKVSKAKPAKKVRADSAEKVLPTNDRERAEAALQDILKDGGAARKLALGLKHVQYGDKLKDELFDFSKKMEELYNSLQKLLLKKHVKDRKFTPFLADLDLKNQWFKRAEVAARGLLQGLKTKKKGKKVEKDAEKKGDQGPTQQAS